MAKPLKMMSKKKTDKASALKVVSKMVKTAEAAVVKVVTSLETKKIDILLAEINKKLEGTGVVARGTQIRCLDADRIQTGILALDYVLNGGLPRGMLVQFKGAESSAKTTSSLKAAAQVINAGGNVGWAASEGFNKTWARQNGVKIPYDETEVATIEKRYGAEGVAKAMEYNDNCPGVFTLAMTQTGDKLLDVIIELLLSNLYDLLVIDSVGHLSNSKEVEGEMGDAQRGGNAAMLGRFCRVLSSIANGQDSAGILWDMMSEKEKAAAQKAQKKAPGGARTAIIAINQLRDRGFSGVPQAPDAGGGWALRHHKVCDVRFQLSEHLSFGGEKKEGAKKANIDDRHIYGRRILVTTTKSKIGPEGRVGYIDFCTDDFGPLKAGQVDRAAEVLSLGIKFALIEKAGAWYRVLGEQFQGTEPVKEWLRENPEACEKIAKDVLTISRSM